MNYNLSERGAVGLKLAKASSNTQENLGGLRTSTNFNTKWNYTTVGIRKLSKTI